MYDLLLVGAGLTAATIAASVKQRLRVCVLDVRRHVAGNCHDHRSLDTQVHSYGAHIYHSASPRVDAFLSQFTTWKLYEHSVSAVVPWGGRLLEVPFPYSRQTEAALGRPLSEAEVIDVFFRGYSRKMWGCEWDELPASVRARVPKHTAETSDYFPGLFTALPSHGYTAMVESMLEGTEVILGVGPHEWEHVQARKVIHTGRPDLVRVPGEATTFGEYYAEELGGRLEYRTLDIHWQADNWPYARGVANFCSDDTAFTRRVCHRLLTGGDSLAVSTERPRDAEPEDPTPYYAVPTPANIQRHAELLARVRERYPDLTFAGRLGRYQYLDMSQAVGHGLAVAEKYFGV